MTKKARKKKGWTKKDWDKYAELRKSYFKAMAKAVCEHGSPLLELLKSQKAF